MLYPATPGTDHTVPATGILPGDYVPGKGYADRVLITEESEHVEVRVTGNRVCFFLRSDSVTVRRRG